MSCTSFLGSLAGACTRLRISTNNAGTLFCRSYVGLSSAGSFVFGTAIHAKVLAAIVFRARGLASGKAPRVELDVTESEYAPAPRSWPNGDLKSAPVEAPPIMATSLFSGRIGMKRVLRGGCPLCGALGNNGNFIASSGGKTCSP